MKKPRASFVFGAIMLTLIFCGYFMGYQFHEEYTQKFAHLVSQNQFISKKYSLLQKNLTKLTLILKDLKTANRRERKDILSKIESITAEIQNLEKEYTVSLDEIKTNLTDLTRVNLGKISVGKESEDEKTALTPPIPK